MTRDLRCGSRTSPLLFIPEIQGSNPYLETRNLGSVRDFIHTIQAKSGIREYLKLWLV